MHCKTLSVHLTRLWVHCYTVEEMLGFSYSLTYLLTLRVFAVQEDKGEERKEKMDREADGENEGESRIYTLLHGGVTHRKKEIYKDHTGMHDSVIRRTTN